ncbi:MAG TPA: hypothetical protein VG963_08715 [Polyangiaceae bacterium]|nr:hypothetical protein [Polyangiaceae bacterium]
MRRHNASVGGVAASFPTGWTGRQRLLQRGVFSFATQADEHATFSLRGDGSKIRLVYRDVYQERHFIFEMLVTPETVRATLLIGDRTVWLRRIDMDLRTHERRTGLVDDTAVDGRHAVADGAEHAKSSNPTDAPRGQVVESAA